MLEIAMTQPAAKAGRHDKPAATDAKAETSETDFDAAYSAEGDREAEAAASDASAEDAPAKEDVKRSDERKVSAEAEEPVLNADPTQAEGDETIRAEVTPAVADASTQTTTAKGRGSDTSELAFAQRLRGEQEKVGRAASARQPQASETPDAQTAGTTVSARPATTVAAPVDAGEGRTSPQSAAPADAQPERTAPPTATASETAKTSALATSGAQAVSEQVQLPRERARREDEPRLTLMRDRSPSEGQTAKVPAPPTLTAPLTPSQQPAALVVQAETSSVDLLLQPVGDLDAPSSWDPRSAAPATLSQTLARPETPGMIGRQMAEALQRFPDRTVELSLNPKELGRVQLSISAAETGITVQVLAERPETLDLMRRNIDQLAREFEALGYESINFAFNEGQSEPGSEDRAEHGSGSMPTHLSGEVEIEAEPPITMVETTGVDIRV